MSIDWISVLLQFVLRASEIACLSYFLSPLTKRKRWPLFTPLMGLAFSIFLVLIHELIYLGNWESEFIYISFAYYPIIFALIMVCYDLSAIEGGYFLLLYFLCIHALRILVIQAAGNFLGILFLSKSTSLVRNLLVIFLIILLLWFVFFTLKRFVFRHPNHRLTWPQMGLSIVATVPVVYMTNLFLVLRVNILELPFSVLVIGLICSICGIIIIIGYNNSLALAKDKQDLVMLETLLATQQKQYQLRKETTDLINAKYHDMKKHLNFLTTIESTEEREKYLENLKSQISIYDAFHNTGNETLDIVISDADMECRKRGIRLLVFVDGNLLNFMSPIDIVTIFSNALENSIEAVSKLESKNDSITVRMHEYDTWLAISIENGYVGKIRWKGDRLATTKPDSVEHGYGLANIRNVVEKYGGNVTTEAREGTFILTLLFPKLH